MHEPTSVEAALRSEREASHLDAYDDVLAQSFPASDPPPFVGGIGCPAR